MAKVRKISTLKVTEVPGLMMCNTEITSVDGQLTPGLFAVVPATRDLPEWFTDKCGLLEVKGRYNSMLYQYLYNSSTKIGYRQYANGKWLPWKQISAPAAPTPATTSE